ncbi:MAG TPA: YciI family protein [Ktedonobacteraceae bacterium]|nr:YciI family protein [Ktedonobacteraceae bacterium]
MRYLLLIYGNETEHAQRNQEAMADEYQGYVTFTNEVRERGVLLSGEALMPTHMATTIRVRNSQTLTTDGPFAETKEQLGGYYLLNCKDLDEAITFAAKIPGAASGSIEIRPVAEFE